MYIKTMGGVSRGVTSPGCKHTTSSSVTYMWQLLVLSLLTSHINAFYEHKVLYSGTWSAAILKNVSDTFWEWKLREFPKFATYRSIHKYDDRLEEFTLGAFKRRKDDCETFVERLAMVDVNDLNQHERQNLAVLSAGLGYFVDGYKWRMYGSLNPINFLEGIHRTSGWIRVMQYNTLEDYEKFLMRMRAYAEQIDQVIHLMREAIRLKRTNHRVSMEGVIKVLEDVLDVPVDLSKFYYPFMKPADQSPFNSTIWQMLTQRGRDHIHERVYPAMRRLKTFIEEEYIPNSRNHYGVGQFENGYEYYQACLRFHLSMNLTAEEVRDIGLLEVARIKALMEGVMEREKFSGTLDEFFDYLREHRRQEFYDRTAAQLLSGYTDIIYNVIQPKVSSIMRMVLQNHLRVKQMTHDGPSGSYASGVFYVNLNRPETRPTFTMMSLALHEGMPGHHLQTVFAKTQPLPHFRQHPWSTKYYAGPFNFPWYTAYTEGWSLYSEYLGEEMGCYNRTALELFGRYSSEIFRACRLVVDTGIHAFNMSRDEAIQYLANHTAIPISQIQTEVDRYITWPGQACAYKIGELEILRMRRKAEKELGAAFDVRDFNEVVLKVSRVPLEVLNEEVNQWIGQTKTQLVAQLYSSASPASTFIAPLTGVYVLSIACLIASWKHRTHL